MFDPLDIERNKHVRPASDDVQPVPNEPVIGSFIPVQREGGDHSLCTYRESDKCWIDPHGFVCSRCTYKRGVPYPT